MWAKDKNLDFMVWAFQISVTPKLERSWKQAKLVCSWLQWLSSSTENRAVSEP